VIVQTTTFPVARSEAFAFLTDPNGWDAWTPFRVQDPDDVRFREPGDELSLSYRSFKVPIGASARLVEHTDGEVLAFDLRIPGAVPIEIRAEFHEAGTGAALVRMIIDFAVPGGTLARSLWKMSIVPTVVRRELRNALDAAHDLLAEPVIREKTR